jgi:hypothetical protein
MNAGESIGNAIPMPNNATIGIRVSAPTLITIRWSPNTKGTDLYRCATRDFGSADSDTIKLPTPCAYVEVETSQACTLSANVSSS